MYKKRVVLWYNEIDLYLHLNSCSRSRPKIEKGLLIALNEGVPVGLLSSVIYIVYERIILCPFDVMEMIKWTGWNQ